MKTTSRKKMLISSVAMLLVAILALGTATFAWFTQSGDPYADNISVSTTKQSKILLASDARNDWTNHLEYTGTSSTMYPASGNGSAWVMGNAADSDGIIDTTTLKNVAPTKDTEVTNVADYVFKEELNIKNGGTTNLDNIKIKIELNADSVSGTTATYARVALVPIDSTKVTANDWPAFPTSNPYIYSSRSTAYTYKPIIAKAGTEGDSITTSTTAEYTVVAKDASTPLAPGDAKYFKLYVWFEGQDEDCVDSLSGHAIPDLKFTVTGEDPASRTTG